MIEWVELPFDSKHPEYADDPWFALRYSLIDSPAFQKITLTPAYERPDVEPVEGKIRVWVQAKNWTYAKMRARSAMYLMRKDSEYRDQTLYGRRKEWLEQRLYERLLLEADAVAIKKRPEGR